MSRIFISGASAGLGLMAAELLVQQGHQVVLQARNAARAEDARVALPGAEAVVEGDLDTITGTKAVAERVNRLGRFDAVIHNAAVGYRESHHLTKDALPHVFAINTLSVYILTALIERQQAHLTQAWLASGEDPKSQVTGKYFHHLKRMEPNPQAQDPALQDRLIAICADISGVTLPT